MIKRHALPIVIALLLAPCVALADPPKAGVDPAAAQALFYDARKLMEAGKYREACPKLEESLRLDPGIGTQFNLADCQEHTGKIATAWARFLDVAAQSKAANQHDREMLARKRAAALEPRVPKVIVDVSSPIEGLEVKRDGIVIGAAAWGTSIPVDPGTHRITASAPGKQTWETRVQMTYGLTSRVAVPRDLPAAVASDSSIAVPSESIADDAPGTADKMADFPEPIVETRGATQRTFGWIVVGLGVAGVGVGTGFGLSSLGKRNESHSHCAGDSCDAAGAQLRHDALRYGNVATIATVAGGATLVGGLILVLTAPSIKAPERVGRIRAAPTAAIGGGGMTIEGIF